MNAYEQWARQADAETEVTTIEGLTPGELNLRAAEELLSRLESGLADRSEAIEMLHELEKQRSFFEEEGLAVPDTLSFAISSFKIFAENGTEERAKTVREMYVKEEMETPAEVLQTAAQLEIEIAAGGSPKELLTRIRAVLPKLAALNAIENEEARNIAQRSRAALEKYYNTNVSLENR